MQKRTQNILKVAITLMVMAALSALMLKARQVSADIPFNRATWLSPQTTKRHRSKMVTDLMTRYLKTNLHMMGTTFLLGNPDRRSHVGLGDTDISTLPDTKTVDYILYELEDPLLGRWGPRRYLLIGFNIKSRVTDFKIYNN